MKMERSKYFTAIKQEINVYDEVGARQRRVGDEKGSRSRHQTPSFIK